MAKTSFGIEFSEDLHPFTIGDVCNNEIVSLRKSSFMDERLFQPTCLGEICLYKNSTYIPFIKKKIRAMKEE